MTTSSVNSAIQASFQKHFNRALIKAMTESVSSGKDSLDPALAIKAMELALQENGVSADAVNVITTLKTDPKVMNQFNYFDSMLNGDDASSTPTVDQTKFSTISLNQGDLSHLKSNVNSGIDLKVPTAVGQSIKGGVNSGLTIKGKWGEFKDASRGLAIEKELDSALKDFDNLSDDYKSDAFEALFKKKNPPVTIELDGKTITKVKLSPKQKALNRIYKALDQSDSYIKEMNAKNAPAKGMLAKAGEYGSKVGAIAGPLANIGGGISAAISAQGEIDKIDDLYKKGIISESEYNARKAQFNLATASGALTITSGVVTGSKSIAQQIIKHTTAGVAQTTAKSFVKIAPGLGDMLAIGMSSISLAKNAIAADQARRSGNTGRTAVYGTMAALDSVNVILNSIALALEFVPGAGSALSLAVNMISVAVDFIKTTIAHFAKLFDNRSEAEKLNEKFTQLVESDGFKKHVDTLADDYKAQGYDIFEYVVDSQSTGIDGSGDAHDTVPAKREIRYLTNGAFQKSFDQLKKAYIDTSYKDGDYHGISGDDLINIIGGGNRNLYGDGGDDIIIDSSGNSKLDGGKGNDYLDGGAGIDEFYGGDGDDVVNIQPGVDRLADGGNGKDTLKVNFGIHDHITLRSSQMQRSLNGIHIDLQNKQAGVGLGKDCLIDKTKYPNHVPDALASFFSGVDATRAASQLDSLLSRGLTSIGNFTKLVTSTSGRQLWQLAKIGNGTRYFTDGESIYRQNADSSIDKGSFSIKAISDSIVSWSNMNSTASVANGREVEALLYLSFSSTDWVRNFENADINLSGSSIANVYGDNANNMIRISNDAFGAVDTRGGDDTIVVESSAFNASVTNNRFRYQNAVNGGIGYDSLVLKNTNANHGSDSYHAYYLVGAGHTELSNFGQFYGHSLGRKEYKMMSISGIESVVLDDSLIAHTGAGTTLDASHLDQGISYVVNLKHKANIVTSKHDDKIKVNSTADGSVFRSSGGDDVLDFGGYQKGGLKVNLETNQIYGGLSGLAYNFDNVFASRFSGDELTGNSRENTLVAQGGSDIVMGMGGSDHLVSRQGIHTLVGGEGSDLYTVMGPENKGKLSVTVQADSKGDVTLMVDYGQGLKTLNPGIHSLNVLGVDQKTLNLLSGISLKDASGKAATYAGLLSVVNNQLELNTSGHFNNLKPNQKIQLQAEYQSTGSYTKIDETSESNILRLGGISGLSDIQFALDEDKNLVIKNKQGQKIIVDVQFGKEFTSGEVSLADLSSNFIKRFSQINLLNTKQDLDMQQFKLKLSDFIKGRTDHQLATKDRVIQSQLKQNYISTGLGDDIIVVDGFTGNSSEDIYAGAGNDIILAKGNWKGTKSGNNVLTSRIVTGSGNDTVVIGDANRTVNVDFVTDAKSGDSNTLVLDYPDMSKLMFIDNGPKGFAILNTQTYEIVASVTGMPQKLAIKSNGNTYLTDNTSQIHDILKGKEAFSAENFTHYMDKDGHTSLNFHSEQSSDMRLWVGRTVNGLHVRLNGKNHSLTSFDMADINGSGIYKKDLIQAIASNAAGELKFADKTLKGSEVTTYLQALLADSSRVHLEPGLSLSSNQIAAPDTSNLTKGEEQHIEIANSSFELGDSNSVQDWITGIGPGVAVLSDNQKAWGGHGNGALMLSGGDSATQILNHATLDASADYVLKLNIATQTQIASSLSIRLIAGHTVIGAVNFSAQQYWSLTNAFQELEMHIDGSNFKNEEHQKLSIEIVQGHNAYPSQGGIPQTLFDNLRLSKLTGAMATFDKDATSTDGSSTKGTTYTLKQLIAPPSV